VTQNSKFPISYSRLSTFENCPLQFEYLYVNKAVQDNGNEFTQYGTRVHESLEHYAKTRDPEHLTLETRKFAPIVDRIMSKEGEKWFEYQMAISPDKTPCDWFSPTVWLRSVADVLIVHKDTAWVLDYKTGKVKDNPTQMQLFACMTMLHFPQVQKVKTSFIWLVHDSTTNAEYSREGFDGLWRGLEQRFARVQEGVDLGVFPAKPSRLCNWCAAKKVCSHA